MICTNCTRPLLWLAFAIVISLRGIVFATDVPNNYSKTRQFRYYQQHNTLQMHMMTLNNGMMNKCVY
jgi:hypothetical protein